MKLLRLALPLMFTAAAYGLRSYANARRNSMAADNPAQPLQTPPQALANAEMTAVLDTLAGLSGKPIASLSPEQARAQPTPADAVKQLMAERGISAEPVPEITVKTIGIPGPHGQIPLHIYTPQGDGPFPVVVYFHGGGFVIADTKVYEASVQALVNGARAVVVSVDYRLAPEHHFPVAPEEAYAAYSWVLNYAQEINGDAKRVAVAGESAGGNLAAVVSLMARNKRQPLPIHALLIYPVVDNNLQNSSYLQNAHAKPLDLAMMKWFFGHYTQFASDADNPYALPNKAQSLAGFPPTTLITAEIDPLHSEGEAFAKRLQHDAVPVAYKHYTGVTHEFFGMGAVLAEAKDAQAFASGELRKAFTPPAKPQDDS